MWRGPAKKSRGRQLLDKARDEKHLQKGEGRSGGGSTTVGYGGGGGSTTVGYGGGGREEHSVRGRRTQRVDRGNHGSLFDQLLGIDHGADGGAGVKDVCVFERRRNKRKQWMPGGLYTMDSALDRLHAACRRSNDALVAKDKYSFIRVHQSSQHETPKHIGTHVGDASVGSELCLDEEQLDAEKDGECGDDALDFVTPRVGMYGRREREEYASGIERGDGGVELKGNCGVELKGNCGVELKGNCGVEVKGNCGVGSRDNMTSRNKVAGVRVGADAAGVKRYPASVPARWQRKLTPQKDDGSSRDRPTGLTNLGNSCYLNSVLQVLFNISECNHLLESLHDRITNAGGELANTAVGTMYSLWKEYTQGVPLTDEWSPLRGSLCPSVLKECLEAYAPNVFSGHGQQDAHECFGAIIESIEKDATAQLGLKSYRSPFSFSLSVHMVCLECKHRTRVIEGATHLSLDLGEEESTTISHLLRKFFSSENIIKNCDGCGQKNVAHRLYRSMHTFPQIIALHLKRFAVAKTQNVRGICRASIYAKSQVLVKAELMVHDGWWRDATGRTLTDVSNRMKKPDKILDTKEKKKKDLTLQGIVYHQGMYMECGHYVADVLCGSDANKEWYRCNDSYVSPMQPGDVGTETASKDCYMLFYSVAS